MNFKFQKKNQNLIFKLKKTGIFDQLLNQYFFFLYFRYSGHFLYQFPLFFVVLSATVLQIANGIQSEAVFPTLFKYGPLTGFVIAAFWTFVRFVHVTSSCLFASCILWLLWNGIYPALLLHYQITLMLYRMGFIHEDPSWYVAVPILFAFLLSALDSEEGMSIRAMLHLSILFTLITRTLCSELFGIGIEGHISTIFLFIILYVDLFLEKKQREQNRPLYINRNPPPVSSLSLVPLTHYQPPVTRAQERRRLEKEEERKQLWSQFVHGEFEEEDDETDPDWRPSSKRKRLQHVAQECVTNRGLCKVCWTEPATILLEPCLHLCMCQNCVGIYELHQDDSHTSNVFSCCPICRTRIRVFKHIFLD